MSSNEILPDNDQTCSHDFEEHAWFSLSNIICVGKQGGFLTENAKHVAQVLPHCAAQVTHTLNERNCEPSLLKQKPSKMQPL